MTKRIFNKRFLGHLAAIFTIIVWGATFISTKILLTGFKPVEILIFRFVIGILALFIIFPHRIKNTTVKEEVIFAFAGFFGVCLYYLLENIALIYTMASNCGVIMSITPFLTGILSFIFIKNAKEKLGLNFFIGFIVAITGIVLICFNGAQFKLNPLGDFLALMAAFAWGGYSILTKKIADFRYPLILTVRKTFFYGLLVMIPISFFFDANFNFLLLKNPVYLLNIIFLGLFASAACFVTWNFALKILGVVKTSVYLYLVPVITVFMSWLILKEPFTIFTFSGTILTILGLFISKKKNSPKN